MPMERSRLAIWDRVFADEGGILQRFSGKRQTDSEQTEPCARMVSGQVRAC